MAASTRKKAGKSPQSQLDDLLDKYTPEVVAAARDCLKKMRARLPGATQLVYDTYNALGVGFGPSEKASDVIFSIVLYPRYVTLFFLQGVGLPDPERLLQGDGKMVRHIKLESPSDLDKPAIRKLMAVALKSAKQPIDSTVPSSLIIRSIAKKQRARRPSAKMIARAPSRNHLES
jgi:hypothetical protein